MAKPNQQLVEALRNRLCVSQDLEDAAADEIERLAALGQRLRSALEPFDEAFGEDDDDLADNTPVVVQIGKRTTLYSLRLGDLRRVRAALKEQSA